MKTIVKSPSECSVLEIDVFEQLAREGNQVCTIGLRDRIMQAEKLVFIWQDDVCVAIAGLKNPLPSYKRKVFRAAGMEGMGNHYQYEVGYIFAKVKGVGNKLMETVLSASEGAMTFATTKDGNEVMQYLLPKFGFSKLGCSYSNDKKEYLGLFGNKI